MNVDDEGMDGARDRPRRTVHAWLAAPGVLFWLLSLAVLLGDPGRSARPLLIPGVACFVAAVLCGGIALLKAAPWTQRVLVVAVNWSTVVSWTPFFVYVVGRS